MIRMIRCRWSDLGKIDRPHFHVFLLCTPYRVQRGEYILWYVWYLSNLDSFTKSRRGKRWGLHVTFTFC